MNKKADHRRNEESRTPNGVPCRKDSANSDRILFDFVDFLARICAEDDYKFFLKTGKVPYNGDNPERISP